MSFSRRRTREFLLQSLYSQVSNGRSYEREIFLSSFFDPEFRDTLDIAYVEALEQSIHEHEGELLATIRRLAPKFDLETMPTIHLLILMIALAEMRFYHDPLMTEKISMNEAVELAKKFSDDTGRAFINGVLSQYQKHRDDFASETPSDFTLFQKSSEI